MAMRVSGQKKQSVLRAGAPVAQHGWPGYEEKKKREKEMRENGLRKASYLTYNLYHAPLDA